MPPAQSLSTIQNRTIRTGILLISLPPPIRAASCALTNGEFSLTTPLYAPQAIEKQQVRLSPFFRGVTCPAPGHKVKSVVEQGENPALHFNHNIMTGIYAPSAPAQYNISSNHTLATKHVSIKSQHNWTASSSQAGAGSAVPSTAQPHLIELSEHRHNTNNKLQ